MTYISDDELNRRLNHDKNVCKIDNDKVIEPEIVNDEVNDNDKDVNRKEYRNLSAAEREVRHEEYKARHVLHESDTHVVHTMQRGGRTPGKEHLTNDQRAHIVLLSKVLGRENAAKIAGVNTNHVSSYVAGQSTRGTDNPDLRKKIQEVLMPVSLKAADLVLKTLGVITTEEIQSEKLKDRVSIARDLASIAEKTMPKGDSISGTVNAQVIFYSPKVNSMDDYEKAS